MSKDLNTLWLKTVTEGGTAPAKGGAVPTCWRAPNLATAIGGHRLDNVRSNKRIRYINKYDQVYYINMTLDKVLWRSW